MKKIRRILFLLIYGDTRERLIPKGFIAWFESQPNKDAILKDLYDLK